MIVERSTAATDAACAMVASPRISCSQISYFIDGVKNFFVRRLRDVTDEDSFLLTTHSFRVSQTVPVWSDQTAKVRHER